MPPVVLQAAPHRSWRKIREAFDAPGQAVDDSVRNGGWIAAIPTAANQSGPPSRPGTALGRNEEMKEKAGACVYVVRHCKL